MKNTIYIILIILLQLIASCSGCSKSGRRDVSQRSHKSNSDDETISSSNNKTVIKMDKQNGVYMVPIEVNGVEMSFIFDTGASSMCISSTEADFLYKQGKLSDNDIIGKQKFMDATGRISVGTTIIFKTVKIGNKTVNNVEATVINNDNAPLLLGQTVLSKFGKVSIDYDKGTITFE